MNRQSINRFLNQKHLLFILLLHDQYNQVWQVKRQKLSRLTVSLKLDFFFLSTLIGSSLGLLYNTLALCDLTGLPAFELKESIKTINTHRNKAKEGSSCKMTNFFWISMHPFIKISLRIQISRSRTSSTCRSMKIMSWLHIRRGWVGRVVNCPTRFWQIR